MSPAADMRQGKFQVGVDRVSFGMLPTWPLGTYRIAANPAPMIDFKRFWLGAVPFGTINLTPDVDVYPRI